MEPSELLSVFAALLLLVAYAIYFRKTSRGDAQPNAASWSLWVFLVALNTVSYGLMTGDSVKAYLSFAGSIAAIAVFVNALVRGRFKRLNKWDIAALTIGFIASFMWWWFRSALYGNLILQLALFISFIPTVSSVLEDPRREPPLPWFLWGVAFAVVFIVVLLRWRGQPQDLVNPIYGIVCHTLVGILALRGREPS